MSFFATLGVVILLLVLKNYLWERVNKKTLRSLKELLKEKLVSQDEERRGEEEIQKLTDRFVGEIDQHLAAKEKEILQV